MTGASGFIGGHVIPELIARGFDVHCVGRSVAPREGTQPHRVDLSDRHAVDGVLKAVRPSHLLHLAWTARGDYYTSPDNVRWLADSLHLMHAFVERGGRRIVGAGSSAEYDLGGHEDLREHVTPLRPNGLYGHCKKALAEVGSAYARARSVSFAWGRVFFCYGPGEHATRLVPRMLSAIEAGERVPFQAGNGVRDYVYVKDVARAFAMLMDSDLEGPVNIGSGSGITLRAFIELLADLAGRPGSVAFGALPTPAYEPARVVADVTRIEAALAWPRWSVDDGLRETIAERRAVQTA